MDRVRILAPTLLAAVALLGEQGARLGPLRVPAIGLGWVLLVVLVVFLTAPKRQEHRLGTREAWTALALALGFAGLGLVRAPALHPPLSLSIVLDDGRVVVADSLQLDARRELRRLSDRRRNVSFQTEAVLEVPRTGEYRFDLDCDDECTVSVGDARFRSSETLTLERGEVPFTLAYQQLGGPARLRFEWSTPAAIELLPVEHFLRDASDESRRPRRLLAHASYVLFVGWWALVSGWIARIAPYRAQIYERRSIPALAAGCIVLYGCLLRFDALWVHSGQAGDVPLRHWLPGYSVFNPAYAPDDPYRADVRSYLDRAETFSVRSFYAPSFREPFYIAVTMPFLALAGGEIGILIQSFFFSCATLVLFFFVAQRLHGTWWAAGLLVPVALHAWLVLEAPSGYRMSAYAFFLLLTVAVTSGSSTGARAAAAAGASSGLLCLIRLSALSVVLPLLVVKLWHLPRGNRLRYAAVALALLLALVGPFLVSNAVEHGDPFYAVSFHTEFWMRAEGLDTSEGPVSFARYFTDFGRAGAIAKGTALGMTVLPIKTFWRGLQLYPLLDAATLSLGLAGLLVSLLSRQRYLALAYICHLVPFAYIQNFPSGEMPRFVMPAYFFLVLAAPYAASVLFRSCRRITIGQYL